MVTSNRYSSPPRPAAPRPGARPRPGTVTRQPAKPSKSSRKLLLPAVAGMSAVALGIVLLPRLQPRPGPQAACLIAVDAQGSTTAVLGKYRSWMPSQAKDCAGAEKAKLSIALVSGQTTTSTVTPVTTDLRQLKLTGNSDNDAQIVDKEITRVVDEANGQILAAPGEYGGTDILGIVCVASAAFKGHPKSKLVLYTDAMNNKAPFQLVKIPLDDASIGKYVDELKRTGQLCDLTGVQVSLFGANIGSGTQNLSAARLAGVQRFWSAVFAGAHADLVAYQRNP